ncbi:MAG: 2-oxoacid:acceptor oxidoreductase family protein, partial [Rhodospirillales bacterium]|nr:2-oxoacid:acceptor oxidoreductase family protein [Rhodospirillales bacterium]
QSYNILLTGIGGTGVITAGALLGTAASIEGMACSVLDQTGLSQKNGAVMSHVRLSDDPDQVFGTRIGTGMADLVLGFDMVVAAGGAAVNTMSGERTTALINDHLVPLAAFAERPDMPLSAADYTDVIRARIGTDRTRFINATHLATQLMGDSITSNIFMMGYAFQKGLIPLSLKSIQKSIDLNGVSVASNQRAFSWGRAAAANLDYVAGLAGGTDDLAGNAAFDLDRFIRAKTADLAAYQNPAYGDRYRRRVADVRVAEQAAGGGARALEEAVARGLYKLMAYKDEYEVARLYSTPTFKEKLAAQFDGDYRIAFNLAPPLFASTDPVTGNPRKSEFSGRWMVPALAALSRLKFLRGSVLDVFGYHPDRREERKLLADYEILISTLLQELTAENVQMAAEIAALVMAVRGYGHVKRRALGEVEEKISAALEQYRNGAAQLAA